MYDKTKYIYVGLDLHKEQHTAVIMDCFNEKLGEITFQNKPSEFGKLITKCKKYCADGKGIVFALENSYGYGRALAAWLIERNYIVKDVNPAHSHPIDLPVHHLAHTLRKYFHRPSVSDKHCFPDNFL